MSYNPHHYKHLFKKGLFGLPNEDLKSGAQSHRLFALNQEPHPFEKKELFPGLVLRKGHIKLPGGFSNYMIFEVDLRVRKIEPYYHRRGIYPVDAFKKNPKALALFNMGYFYLTTDERKDECPPPSVRSSNFLVISSRLFNLPVFDRSALLQLKGGTLKLEIIEARGKLSIGGSKFSWRGSRSLSPGEVTVYNSNNLRIENRPDPTLVLYRQGRKTYIAPAPRNKLLVVKEVKSGLRVSRVERSQVLINGCDMVLEVPESLTTSAGDRVEVLSIGGYPVERIANAVSIGPILRSTSKRRRRQVRKEGFHKDSFLSNSPHRENQYSARSCLILPGKDKLACLVVDGIPSAGRIYPGVTPRDLANLVRSLYPRRLRTVCTDPGKTVKAVYKDDGRTHVFGNTYYLAYRLLRNGTSRFWPNGVRGRKVYTMLIVK